MTTPGSTKSLPRGFKGVWLPRDLYLDKNFTWTEKILLCEIDSLDTDDRGCYASDEYLAEFLAVERKTVSNLLSKLRSMKAITYVSFDGKNRGLRSLIHNPDADRPAMEDPSKSLVIAETEKLLGFALDLYTRERIDVAVDAKYLDEWRTLVKNRLVGLAGRADAFVTSRIGYWLQDWETKEMPRILREVERARGGNGNGHSNTGGRVVEIPNQVPAGLRCDDCRETDGLVSAANGMRKCRHPKLQAAA